MKNIIAALLISFTMLFSAGAFAEASFNQIQTLIEKQEYHAAEKGLEEIINNHPNSAKAFYAMAQAQAGLGNLIKAQHALDKAMGINPALDFAPTSSVENLKQAIHPQVAKIEIIEESHFWRNVLLIILFIATLGIAYYFYDKNEKATKAKLKELELQKAIAERMKFERERIENKKVAPSATVTQKVKAYTAPSKEGYSPETKVTPTDVKPVQYAASAPTTPVVVNNTSSNSATDVMLGVMLGNAMSNSSHHHEVVREREIIREVPVKSSSWDDKPSESTTRSSSWDDSSSSSNSSKSWDDDSSSKRSSSWSSSNDSSSSSSWDSGSSSSDSGSSWD